VAASELAGRLIWSVDPRPVSPDTRSDLLRTIPVVVEGLRTALQEISWDPFATDSVIRDLELVHVDVLQNLVTAPVEPAEDVAEFSEVEFDVNVEIEPPLLVSEVRFEVPEQFDPGESEEDSVEIVDQTVLSDEAETVALQWLDAADQLSVGSWLELNKDDARVRCKLAAFIKATGKYIFVNRNGAKVAEYFRDELALAMQEKSITLLDDGLIFDRALESIIDNLRQNRKD
jgi:hypothetical protein